MLSKSEAIETGSTLTPTREPAPRSSAPPDRRHHSDRLTDAELLARIETAAEPANDPNANGIQHSKPDRWLRDVG